MLYFFKQAYFEKKRYYTIKLKNYNARAIEKTTDSLT